MPTACGTHYACRRRLPLPAIMPAACVTSSATRPFHFVHTAGCCNAKCQRVHACTRDYMLVLAVCLVILVESNQLDVNIDIWCASFMCRVAKNHFSLHHINGTIYDEMFSTRMFWELNCLESLLKLKIQMQFFVHLLSVLCKLSSSFMPKMLFLMVHLMFFFL